MKDPVKLASVLLAAVSALVLATPASAERPAAAERRLVELARDEAASRQVLLRQDERVDAAAEAIAAQALAGVTGRGPSRMALWEAGVRDARFEAFVLLADRAPSDVAARQLLAANVDWEHASVGAVAVVTEKRRTAVAFVFAERVARFRDDATVVLPTGARPQLVTTDPLGRVTSRRITAHPVKTGAWSFDPSAPVPGRWLFELVDSQTGALAAIWLAPGAPRLVARPDPSTPVPPPVEDPLGLGPGGLGGFGAAPIETEDSGWMLDPGRAPDRPPAGDDIASVELALWTLVQARRQVAGQGSPRRWTALTPVARGGGSTALRGAHPGPLAQRLVADGVGALRPEEHLLSAGTPMVAWSLLLAEEASRGAILGPKALGTVGVALREEGPGAWSLGLSLLFAAGRTSGATSWRELLLAHLQDDRDGARLPRLGIRGRLDTIAATAAEQVAAAGHIDLDEGERAALIQTVKDASPGIRGVGIDVLVTTSAEAVTGRRHGLDSAYSEVGLGVVEPAGGLPGQPPGSVVVVLVFVQR